MKYFIFIIGLFSFFVFDHILADSRKPLWECSSGQEPIQYLEELPSGKNCGAPSAVCLVTGAPSSFYHYLCPARAGNNPQACPAGEKLLIIPSLDSPLIECGRLRENCFSLDQPRNTLYDCRNSVSLKPTQFLPEPIKLPSKIKQLPIQSNKPKFNISLFSKLIKYLFSWNLK